MEDKTTLIYGRNPIIEAINSGQPVDKVFIQQGVRGPLEKEIRDLCRAHLIPLQVIPKERMNTMVRGNHQGLIAYLAEVRYYRLEDVVPGIFERSEMPLLLLLDGVTDVRNLGAIARSGEVMGAHALVVSQKRSAPINAEAMKTSAGALNHLPVCREPNLQSAIDQLQMMGIKVIASDLKAEKVVYNLDLTGPVAIVVGAEGKGISREVLLKSDQRFVIPQKGQTDSLNVSVAAGMILYEARRQRLLVKGH